MRDLCLCRRPVGSAWSAVRALLWTLTRQGMWRCFCKMGSLVPQRLEETISSFRLAGLV